MKTLPTYITCSRCGAEQKFLEQPDEATWDSTPDGRILCFSCIDEQQLAETLGKRVEDLTAEDCDFA